MEVKEVRRGKPGAVYVDQALTFVWSKFAEKGYVTQWAEDEQSSACFHLRMMGFERQPVHHYSRPFFLLTDTELNDNLDKYCHGSRSRYQVFLDWLAEGLLTNKGKPFFTFAFTTELSKDENTDAHMLDEGTVAFMQFLKTRGFLKHTVFLFMSDHGARYGEFRSTEQGRVEERRPCIGVYVPESFKKKFPEKYKALKTNTIRLTSPFDIHETLRDVLNEFSDKTASFTAERGSSLFREISTNRTCTDAGIGAHYCSCIRWIDLPVSDSRAVSAVNHVHGVINDMVLEHAGLCHPLIVNNIVKAIIYQNEDGMLKTRENKNRDQRISMMDNIVPADAIYIQVTFILKPGYGRFEATVRHDAKNNRYIVDNRDISRVNLYGDDSICITTRFPHLRPYCVCT